MYQSQIKNGKKRTNRFEKQKGIIEPEEDQEYAIVKELIGNGRCRVLCTDGQLRLGRIRGSMRKSVGKVIISKGDLVLISIREYEKDKVDIFHKFLREDASYIINSNDTVIPDALVKAWTYSSGFEPEEGTDNVVFREGEDIDIDKI
jgi:translation initiation factor 1A